MGPWPPPLGNRLLISEEPGSPPWGSSPCGGRYAESSVSVPFAVWATNPRERILPRSPCSTWETQAPKAAVAGPKSSLSQVLGLEPRVCAPSCHAVTPTSLISSR